MKMLLAALEPIGLPSCSRTTDGSGPPLQAASGLLERRHRSGAPALDDPRCRSLQAGQERRRQ